jgi:hypothetical protein
LHAVKQRLGEVDEIALGIVQPAVAVPGGFDNVPCPADAEGIELLDCSSQPIDLKANESMPAGRRAGERGGGCGASRADSSIR